MVTSSPRTRYYLAFGLLAVLTALLHLSAQAAPAPEASTSQRALAYTRHLAQVLHLQPHQLQPVLRSTEQQLVALDSLTARPGASSAAHARPEARYLAALQPVLTPAQHDALLVLRQRTAPLPAARRTLLRPTATPAVADNRPLSSGNLAPGPAFLEGYVMGAGGRALPGVTARVAGSALLVVSNADGLFRLPLPTAPGKQPVRVVCSYAGLADCEINLEPRQRVLSLEMLETAPLLSAPRRWYWRWSSKRQLAQAPASFSSENVTLAK